MTDSNNPYKIELVANNDMTYYQVVRKRDDAILYANPFVENIALFVLSTDIYRRGVDAPTELRNWRVF